MALNLAEIARKVNSLSLSRNVPQWSGGPLRVCNVSHMGVRWLPAHEQSSVNLISLIDRQSGRKTDFCICIDRRNDSIVRLTGHRLINCVSQFGAGGAAHVRRLDTHSIRSNSIRCNYIMANYVAFPPSPTRYSCSADARAHELTS